MYRFNSLTGAALLLLVCTAFAASDMPSPATQPVAVIPEPKQVGGESQGVVQVANLIYAGSKSSKCFADHFLVRAETDSKISTSRRFHSVKLSSEELFEFPLVIMTGEGAFELPKTERENLRKFVEGGGLLLASSGCSSPDWDRSFRAEMAKTFSEHRLKTTGMDNSVFHTVYDMNELKVTQGGTPHPLEGITIIDRLGVLY